MLLASSLPQEFSGRVYGRRSLIDCHLTSRLVNKATERSRLISQFLRFDDAAVGVDITRLDLRYLDFLPPATPSRGEEMPLTS